MDYTLDFSQIGLNDIGQVGGKNASLGELFNTLGPQGVGVLDGFATTAAAFRQYLQETGLAGRLQAIFSGLDITDVSRLAHCGQAARQAVLDTPLPAAFNAAILAAYDRLVTRLGRAPEMAVRSSATAEDLPQASFAGQHETFLNIAGKDALLEAAHACLASLFTDRAIHYRAEQGFGQLEVALSVGVMPMVRSDVGSAGVIFTLDPDSGFRDVIVISGSYGLGEYVVQGEVVPDEWVVFKTTLKTASDPIISRTLGSKEARLVYGQAPNTTQREELPEATRRQFCLSDAEVLQLARWAWQVEDVYSRPHRRPQPMDLEWARDGLSGQLTILQARPETVHSAKPRTAISEVYRLTADPGRPLINGQAVGEKIGSGRVFVAHSTADLGAVQAGDVLVAARTDPDWEPVMQRAAAIITNEGGRTAHAAIVSRELGLPCIVGTGNATQLLRTGQTVTVCCAQGAEGHVYAGEVPFTIEHLDAASVPMTATTVQLNIADPGQAFQLSAIPNGGVGLARMEFIITHEIGIHPMALVRYPALQDQEAAVTISEKMMDEDPKEFFIRRLAEGIGRIAAAFHPQPVVVRMSDFKTNEYARLLGGKEFEPREENPMLGFRGASRYYDERYREGFALECRAILRARETMGLENIIVMIPFCRTVEEGRHVLAEMAANGLRQGENALQVYAMCELPANIELADEFLQVFDGYSIGSNDLTQLVLGIDRDSGTVAHLFDERNDAVLRMIARVIETAHAMQKHIGICGQAPSDYPDFARWLVARGIDSISLNPDAAMQTTLVIAEAEQQAAQPPLHEASEARVQQVLAVESGPPSLASRT